MANYATLKASVNNVITTNANNEITGALLNQLLKAIIDSLGVGYQYAGIATPSTNPGTPDQRVFYIATQKGLYPNFGSTAAVADSEIVVFSWDGTWAKKVISADKNFFVGENDEYKEVRIYNLKPGGKYELIVKNPDFDRAGVTVGSGSAIFSVMARDASDITIERPVFVGNGGTVAGSYTFTLPANTEYLRIGGRATINEIVYFELVNVGVVSEQVTKEIAKDFERFCVAYENTYLNIDNTRRKLIVEGGNFIVRKSNGTQYLIARGTEYDLPNEATALIKFVFNSTNNAIEVFPYSQATTMPIIATLIKGANMTDPYREVIHSVVKIAIDGVLVENIRIDARINEKLLDGTIPDFTAALGASSEGLDVTTLTPQPGQWANGVYQANNQRVSLIIPINGEYRVAIVTATGYKMSCKAYTGYPSPATLIANSGSGWADAYTFEIPIASTIKYLTVNIRGDNYGVLDVNDVAQMITVKSFKTLMGEEVTKIINEYSTEDASGSYEGEKISLDGWPFKRETFRSLAVSFSQSMAIYGDYVVFAYGSPNYGTGSLWRISTGAKIADITFPHGTLNVPHGNTICFGKEFASGNSDLPLLYLSQWDGESGCLVYNLQADGTIALVQTITASGMDSSIYGGALGDWVVDTDNGYIYSVRYLINASATEADGNKMLFCKFALPTLADGAAVTFAPANIIDSFSTQIMRVSQDKTYLNGKIYVIAGNDNTSDYLYVVSLLQKDIVTRVSLNQWGGEPECLSVYNNDGQNELIYSYGAAQLYKLSFYQ